MPPHVTLRCLSALAVAAASVAVCAQSVDAARGATGAQSPDVTIAPGSVQPGDLLMVGVTLGPTAADVRVAAFQRSTLAYASEAGAWQALVGIDLDTAPGSYPIVVTAIDAGLAITRRTAVVVQPKRFATRQLRVDPGFVTPPAAVQARIARESALLAKTLAASTPRRLWDGAWVRPVPHAANSSFGTRSVFNGQPRSPHAGTDFRSPAGTPVKAPVAGRVVLAQDLYFSGRTVIIDHGLDVFSQLLHLSRIDVREGEDIAAGTVVGLVGATGRVTGAHLHWGLRVGGARVDPLSALALLGGDAAR